MPADTREGEVYRRLLEKLEEARERAGRPRFTTCWASCSKGRALRELLMEAVLYGDDPKRKQRLFTAVDGVVDKEKIEKLIRERKLTSKGSTRVDHRDQGEDGASGGPAPAAALHSRLLRKGIRAGSVARSDGASRPL